MAASSRITLSLRDEVSRGLRNLKREMVGFKRDVDGLASGLGKVAAIGGGAMAVDMLWNIGKASVDAQIQVQRLETAFTAVYDSAARGGVQLDYLRDLSARLGLEFYSTAEAAKNFFASGQGTALQGQLNGIYESFSKAGAALALSGDQMNSVFTALGQMMSKGKVQAEELRGQLGESLPGAFTMAAKAMGVTTAELDKMLEDGRLLAEDLLPRMAEALEDKYAAAAERAANSLQGSINRMSSAWTEFKTNILNSEPVVEAIQAVTGALEHVNTAKAYGKRREEAIAHLRASGVAPEGVRTEARMDMLGTVYGAEFHADRYSEAQIRQRMQVLEIERRQQAVFDDYVKAQEIAAEQTLGKLNALTRDVIKTTDGHKLREYDSRIAELDAAFEAARPELSARDLERYTADYNAARAKLLEDRKDFQDKLAASDRKAAGAASRAAVAQADYTGELERTRRTVASLREQLDLDPSDKLAARKIAAEEKYRKTLSKTREELEKQVARGSLTREQAEALRLEKDRAAELRKQVDLREAEREAAERAVKTAEGQLRFYGELESMSGRYSGELELQNTLLEAQAQNYRDLDIPEDLIDQWRTLRQLQESTDPLAGAYRGLARWLNEARDAGKQWEDMAFGMAQSFETATRGMFDEFLTTGRMTFKSFNLSFTSLLRELAWQALAQPIVLSVVQGAQSAVYGLASGAGGFGGSGGAGGLGGLASGALQQAGQGWITNGLSGTINSAAAWAAPSLFAPTAAQGSVNAGLNAALQGSSGAYTGYTAGMQPTMTATGAFGAPALGAGIGSLASPFVNSALGIQNNAGSSLGATVGGLGATAVLGTLAAANIWNPGGWIMGGLAALSAVAGGALGGIFGKKKKKLPQLWAGFDLDLANGTTGAWADPNRGLSNKVADQYEASLETLAQSVITMSGNVKAALGATNTALADAYQEALVVGGSFKKRVMWEGEYITEGNTKRFQEELLEGGMGLIVGALSRMDVRPLTLAADGAVADTADELKVAIANSVNFLNIGASFEDEKFQKQFYEGIGNRVLDALNGMDTSGLKLNIDKTSVAGWQTAAAALEAWDSINASITEIINPTSELETQMRAANAQFDGWLDNLRQLGWQEEAIAQVEARRAAYLQKYSDAMTKATTQELHLRKISLQYGANSNMYGMESLYIQQQQELEQLAQKFGRESQIYKDAVEIQQAELARQRVEQLEAELEAALQAEQRLAQEEAQAALAAAQASLAAAEAAKAATEQRIAELERELEEARQAVIDAQQARVDAQQERVDALQAEFDAALKAQQDKVAALQAELEAALRARTGEVENQISEAEKLRDVFGDIVKRLRESREDLWTSEDRNPIGTAFDEALAQFNAAFAEGMRGNTEALEKLPTLASDVLGLSGNALTSQAEYTKLFYDVDQKLRQAEEYAAGESAKRLSEIDALNAQLAALKAQLNVEEETHRDVRVIQAELAREQAILDEFVDAEEVTHRNLKDIRKELEREQKILEQQKNILDDLTKVEEASHRTQEEIQADLDEQRLLLEQQTEAVARGNALVEAQTAALQAAMNAGTNATTYVGRTSAEILAELQRVRNVLASEKGDVGTVTPTVPEPVRPGTGGGSGSGSGSGSSGGSSSGSGSGSSGSSGSGSGSGSVKRTDQGVLLVPNSGKEKPQVAAGSGIYGSRYRTVADLMNAIWSGLTYSTSLQPTGTGWGWTFSDIDKSLQKAGLTLEQWYTQIGKARGFASGGLTPRDEPFWVGENGPELMMSPRQYGVLSHPESMALASGLESGLESGFAGYGGSGGYGNAGGIGNIGDIGNWGASIVSEIRTQGRQTYTVLRQLLRDTSEMRSQQRRILRTLGMWEAEGLPRTAAR